MTNVKKVLAGMALMTGLLALAGCVFPDYQLLFDITASYQSDSYVYVDYTLENAGMQGMTGASLQVEVDTGSGTSSGWTWGTDLYAGEYDSGTLAIYVGSATYTAGSARVTGVSWDDME